MPRPFLIAGELLAKTPPGPPDFGSEAVWLENNVALLRVISVKDGVVNLRTERTYAGKVNPQVSVPLSAIWFGWHHPPENPLSIVANPVSVQEGDALIVWPGRWQPAEHPFLPGQKVVGEAAKSHVVQALEEICQIREAGGRSQGFETGDELKRVTEHRDAGGEAALKRVRRVRILPFSGMSSRCSRPFHPKRVTTRSPTS